MGKVSIVGAGPGRADYITVRGIECLQTADAVVYDHLSGASFFQYTKPGCQLIYAGKQAANHHLIQEEINQLLLTLAEKYPHVVRLKGGDPFIFGRGGEEALALHSSGIPYEVVPGISASNAAALSAGIPVTHRGIAASFHVITGHEKKGKQTISYQVLAQEEGTLIFLMGLHEIQEITEKLIRFGKSKNTPCAVVSCGTTAHEKTVTAPLCEIAKQVLEQRISSPAVIIIGDVVRLKEQIGTKKAYHKNILVTGSSNLFEGMKRELQPYNILPIHIPLIKTIPMSFEDFQSIDFFQFTHFVFTSKEGVRIFFDYLKRSGKDIRTLFQIHFCVVGKQTEKALNAYGVYADIVPEDYSSRGLAKELESVFLGKERVLLLRAFEHSDALDRMLDRREIFYQSVAIYRTETDLSKRELLQVFEKDMDIVVLGSGLAASAYQKLRSGRFHPYIISIGENCTAAAKKAGLTVNETAKQSDSEGIVSCILKMCE